MSASDTEHSRFYILLSTKPQHHSLSTPFQVQVSKSRKKKKMMMMMLMMMKELYNLARFTKDRCVSSKKSRPISSSHSILQHRETSSWPIRRLTDCSLIVYWATIWRPSTVISSKLVVRCRRPAVLLLLDAVVYASIECSVVTSGASCRHDCVANISTRYYITIHIRCIYYQECLLSSWQTNLNSRHDDSSSVTSISIA